MVAHTCDSIIWVAETGDLQAQVQPALLSKTLSQLKGEGEEEFCLLTSKYDSLFSVELCDTLG